MDRDAYTAACKYTLAGLVLVWVLPAGSWLIWVLIFLAICNVVLDVASILFEETPDD